jgi:signal transduction histidine kinase
LKTIGQQVGVAVENAHLYEQAEQAAAMAERNRLARELHDSVTQSLYSVTLYAEAAARLLTAGQHTEATHHLRELRDTAQEALREMRLLIFELRPPALEKSGLVAALQARLEAVEGRGGMLTELQVEGAQEADRVPLIIQEELFQIAREALNNVLKHAHALHVRVQVQFSDTVACLEVSDDGVGFDPVQIRERGGLGLPGMKERAQKIGADLQIRSDRGKGTSVRAMVRVAQGAEPSNGVSSD